ncbi:MAG: DUF1849 family protein [Alphaproteobacteria bacterium]|nr:DUF1849 family protein [Alphaproteobacteria bacterium]
MLTRAAPLLAMAAACGLAAGPLAAQDFAPHRAAYNVTPLPGAAGGGVSGSYAYELRATCDSFTIVQRLRLEFPTGTGTLAHEQQSRIEESRDGRSMRFDHTSTVSGRRTERNAGEARLAPGGAGDARFSEPAGQSVALPADTLFPIGIARAVVRRFQAGENGLEARFFFGDKAKPPRIANAVIGRVPRRLADLAVPESGRALAEGRQRVYFRVGFFEPDAKDGGTPAYEMGSVTLDNGVELYGTHEQRDMSIEYRIVRLEALEKPTCN